MIGRTITVDSRPKEIVGVMPQGFRIGNAEADVIWPAGIRSGKIDSRRFQLSGRRPAQAGNHDRRKPTPTWRE